MRIASRPRTSSPDVASVPEGTKITFPNGVVVGGEEVVLMAGPCSVESREANPDQCPPGCGCWRAVSSRGGLQAA